MIILYFNSRKKYAATKKYGPAPAPPRPLMLRTCKDRKLMMIFTHGMHLIL